MKLPLKLFLLSLFVPSVLFAHESYYVCQGQCSFDRGYGVENLQLDNRGEDVQKTYNTLIIECKNLDKNFAGVLEPLIANASPKISDFCKLVWH